MVAVLLSVGAGSANAAMLPPVTVNGLDWLQPVDFVGYSWNDINTVCDATSGLCNGSVGGNNLTGWTWASVDDVNALFNHYIGSLALGPGPDRLVEFGSSWISGMMQDGFLLTTSQLEGPGPRSAVISAFVRTLDFDGNPHSTQISVIAVPRADPVQSAYTDLGTLKDNQSAVRGSWFVRDANASSVPITNTLALVGLGICALGLTGRKHTPATAVAAHLS